MFRTLFICAVVSASAIACSSATQPRPDARMAAQTPLRPCVVSSASRIPAKPDQCSVVPGRSYSQTDVERTGQTNAGDALQMLDPSITVHH